MSENPADSEYKMKLDFMEYQSWFVIQNAFNLIKSTNSTFFYGYRRLIKLNYNCMATFFFYQEDQIRNMHWQEKIIVKTNQAKIKNEIRNMRWQEKMIVNTNQAKIFFN